MAKRIIKIFFILLLISGVVAYILFAIINKPNSEKIEICQDIVFDIVDDSSLTFIDSISINKALIKAKVYPVGKFMYDVDLEKMEKTLRHNQYIDSVECFKTLDSKVCVRIKQRIPVIFVIPDSLSDGFFVDSYGKFIPPHTYICNILVATGDITRDYAKTHLAEFGNFIMNDKFWNNMIEQVHITKTRGHEPFVELIMRIGNHTVNLGSINDFESKLNRLKVFYKKAIPEIGWNRYSRLNLEYGGQIIGTKYVPPAPIPVAEKTDSVGL